MMTLSTESEDKLPCLENGLVRHENRSNVSFVSRLKRHSSCSQLLQIAKVILYFELGFLIGWIGCIYLWNSMGNNYNSTQTGTVHSSESSAMKFVAPDFNRLLDFEYTLTINRGKRSSEGNTRENCMRRVNETRENFVGLIKQIIVGDDSDETIVMLREKCRLQMVSLTTRVMAMELASAPSSPRPTDEEWGPLAMGIKEGLMNDTAGEYRQQIEASGPPTQQMINDLRTTIRAMIRNYKDCEKVLPVGEPSSEPSLADVLNLRDKCAMTFVKLKDDLRPFEAQIVPGNASDPIIAQLRGKVQDMATLLASALTVREVFNVNGTAVLVRIINITDEEILQHLTVVKADLVSFTDAEHQRQLYESGPPSAETVNQIRTLITKYLNDVIECDDMWELIAEVRKAIQPLMPKKKRSTPQRKNSGSIIN